MYVEFLDIVRIQYFQTITKICMDLHCTYKSRNNYECCMYVFFMHISIDVVLLLIGEKATKRTEPDAIRLP